MKLLRENFKKEGVDGDVVYTYTCNDTEFKMGVWGYDESNRTIYVWKGEEPKREFNDVLEAWNYFEQLLTECEPQQQSSGGYMKNPEQDPNVLPLLAIKGNKAILFVLLDDGRQVNVFEFTISSAAMPSSISAACFVVDWANENVPDLLKCEILMKKYDLVFEEDTSADVFLFIPKSIVSQGGQEGGGTESEEPQGKEGEGEPTGKKGKKKGEKGEEGEEGDGEPTGEDGEPTDEGGEPTEEEGGQKGDGEPTGEDGEPTDEEGGQKGDGEPTGEGGEPTDEEGGQKGDGEPTGEGGEPTDEEGEPTDKRQKQPKGADIESGESKGFKTEISKGNFSQLMQQLSACTGIQISVLVSAFRNVNAGVSFLSSTNFSKLKECMGLPDTTTIQQLSQLIINSK